MLGQLTESQIRRYSRQILLPEVGGRGQRKLLAARVRLRGSGEVAATAGVYLAAAGVGLAVLDEGEAAARMAARMHGINPEVRAQIGGALDDVDLAVDATGDPPVARAKPQVWAAAAASVGRVSRMVPCRRCLPAAWFGSGAPLGACAEAVLGSLLAVETLQALLGIGAGLVDRVLEYDPANTVFRTVSAARDPACSECGGAA